MLWYAQSVIARARFPGRNSATDGRVTGHTVGVCQWSVVRDAPGSGYTRTEARHVEATAAAYSYAPIHDMRRSCEERTTCLEQHDRRVCHLHKGEGRRGEERLDDKRRFERDMEEEYDRA